MKKPKFKVGDEVWCFDETCGDFDLDDLYKTKIIDVIGAQSDEHQTIYRVRDGFYLGDWYGNSIREGSVFASRVEALKFFYHKKQGEAHRAYMKLRKEQPKDNGDIDD